MKFVAISPRGHKAIGAKSLLESFEAEQISSELVELAFRQLMGSISVVADLQVIIPS